MFIILQEEVGSFCSHICPSNALLLLYLFTTYIVHLDIGHSSQQLESPNVLRWVQEEHQEVEKKK